MEIINFMYYLIFMYKSKLCVKDDLIFMNVQENKQMWFISSRILHVKRVLCFLLWPDLAKIQMIILFEISVLYDYNQVKKVLIFFTNKDIKTTG